VKRKGETELRLATECLEVLEKKVFSIVPGKIGDRGEFFGVESYLFRQAVNPASRVG
jgi:hypothetical protein